MTFFISTSLIFGLLYIFSLDVTIILDKYLDNNVGCTIFKQKKARVFITFCNNKIVVSEN